MRVALRPRGRTARRSGTIRPHGRLTPPPLVPLITIVALALVMVCAPAAAQDSAKEEIETCLSCHSDGSLSVTFANGQSHALTVNQDAFAHSVHGGNLKCTDCHPGMGEIPHPERKYKDLPQFRASFREACKSCHFDNYTQSLDGVHYTLLARGDTRAPACADCHGSHAIVPAGKPRAAISRTCARCHSAISDVYAKSVHGKSLLDGNDDVPVCTDCHRSHDIADPRSAAWLVKTPELCGKCHTNKPLMAKYGLSPNVVSTYLTDFHGMSASLTNRSGTAARTGAPHRALHRLPRRTQHHARRGARLAGPESQPRHHVPEVSPGRARMVPRRVALALRAILAEGADRLLGHGLLPHLHTVRDRRPRAPDPPAPVASRGEPMSDYLQRFSLRQRVEHFLVMSLFTLLALTGFPQKFYAAGWAHTIVWLFGGVERMRFAHRLCGLAFASLSVFHVLTVGLKVATGRARPTLVPAGRISATPS